MSQGEIGEEREATEAKKIPGPKGGGEQLELPIVDRRLPIGKSKGLKEDEDAIWRICGFGSLEDYVNWLADQTKKDTSKWGPGGHKMLTKEEVEEPIREERIKGLLFKRFDECEK